MRNLWVEIKADNTNQGKCFAGAKIHTIYRKVSSMKSVSRENAFKILSRDFHPCDPDLLFASRQKGGKKVKTMPASLAKPSFEG